MCRTTLFSGAATDGVFAEDTHEPWVSLYLPRPESWSTQPKIKAVFRGVFDIALPEYSLGTLGTGDTRLTASVFHYVNKHCSLQCASDRAEHTETPDEVLSSSCVALFRTRWVKARSSCVYSGALALQTEHCGEKNQNQSRAEEVVVDCVPDTQGVLDESSALIQLGLYSTYSRLHERP